MTLDLLFTIIMCDIFTCMIKYNNCNTANDKTYEGENS